MFGFYNVCNVLYKSIALPIYYLNILHQYIQYGCKEISKVIGPYVDPYSQIIGIIFIVYIVLFFKKLDDEYEIFQKVKIKMETYANKLKNKLKKN